MIDIRYFCKCSIIFTNLLLIRVKSIFEFINASSERCYSGIGYRKAKGQKKPFFIRFRLIMII